jgi:hypothetical protein
MGFPAYGMAGIGIAAAVGFVFVLSFLGNNNGVVDDAGNVFQSTPPEQQRTGDLTADQESGGDASMFAKDSQEAMDSAPAEKGASMMQVDARPTLTSLVAMNEHRNVIREFADGNEFQAGVPVLIQAQFTNENEVDSTGNFMTIGITGNGEGEGLLRQEIPFEHAVNLQADIAANSSVALELRWTPEVAGNYTLLVFSEKSIEATDIQEPAASVSIRVVE